MGAPLVASFVTPSRRAKGQHRRPRRLRSRSARRDRSRVVSRPRRASRRSERARRVVASADPSAPGDAASVDAASVTGEAAASHPFTHGSSVGGSSPSTVEHAATPAASDAGAKSRYARRRRKPNDVQLPPPRSNANPCGVGCEEMPKMTTRGHVERNASASMPKRRIQRWICAGAFPIARATAVTLPAVLVQERDQLIAEHVVPRRGSRLAQRHRRGRHLGRELARSSTIASATASATALPIARGEARGC